MTTPFSRHLKTLTAALLGSLIVTVAHAGDKHTVSDTSHTTKTIQKHVIKVQAGGAEIIEADVSNLAPGEARSYTTDSGHMVDILKGIDGIEIYLDGTLIETEFGAEAHAATMAQRHEWLEACTSGDDVACEQVQDGQFSHEVEIICASGDEADCEALSRASDEEILLYGQQLHTEGTNVVVIRKAIRESGTD